MNMNTKLYFAAALAISLTACSKGNEQGNPADGAVAARVSAGIGGVQTRASGSSWEQGDSIGISTVEGTATTYANIPYSYNGSGFKDAGTVIYFQSDEQVTFNAYYPFAGTSGSPAGTITATTRAADQEATESQPSIDFLFACGAKADKFKPAVSFTDKSAEQGSDNSFKHRMSQITLRLTEGDDMLFEGKLSSYTLKGLVLEGSFNTQTGIAATSPEGVEEDLTIALSDVAASAKTYTTSPVILFPQTPSQGKIGLEIIVEGQSYRANLSLQTLEAGNNYIFPVTVRKTGLSIGEVEIDLWTEIVGTPADATM